MVNAHHSGCIPALYVRHKICCSGSTYGRGECFGGLNISAVWHCYVPDCTDIALAMFFVLTLCLLQRKAAGLLHYVLEQ